MVKVEVLGEFEAQKMRRRTCWKETV